MKQAKKSKRSSPRNIRLNKSQQEELKQSRKVFEGKQDFSKLQVFFKSYGQPSIK